MLFMVKEGKGGGGRGSLRWVVYVNFSTSTMVDVETSHMTFLKSSTTLSKPLCC